MPKRRGMVRDDLHGKNIKNRLGEMMGQLFPTPPSPTSLRSFGEGSLCVKIPSRRKFGRDLPFRTVFTENWKDTAEDAVKNQRGMAAFSLPCGLRRVLGHCTPIFYKIPSRIFLASSKAWACSVLQASIMSFKNCVILFC